ncbi:S8 family peptidase [Patescibacteria group bacterium]
MKTKLYSFVGMFAIVAMLFGVVGLNSFTSHAAPTPHRVIVTFEQAVNENARIALEGLGGRTLKDLSLINGIVVLLPDEAKVPQVEALVGVKRVEQDARVFTLAPPGACSPWPSCKDSGDDDDSTQPAEVLEWGVDYIDADLAWTTSRGLGIDVAIIDTGIDRDHEDLVDNLKGGVNFVSKNPRKPADANNWDDDNGHGTHVAGIVAAVDNEIGVIGVAPEAHLWAVKALDRNGSGYTSDIIDGINWAVTNGMDVINMSLGTASDIQALHDAVDAADAAGVVVVAAAGNSGDGDGATNEVIYPAKYSSVIAVAATASDDSTPDWSSEGEEVEIAAPGVNIRSTWNDGLYDTKNGTSMASPHVAGTVALMLESGIASVDVRAILQTTADDLGAVGFDNFYGYGLVDAERATAGI